MVDESTADRVLGRELAERNHHRVDDHCRKVIDVSVETLNEEEQRDEDALPMMV